MAADGVRRRLPAAGSVRVRTTAAALLAVGLALVAGALLLVAVFRHSLLGELETSARLRATGIAADVAAGEGIPATVGDGDDLLVQVLSADGRVVLAGPAIAALPPLGAPGPDDAVEVRLPVDDRTFLVVGAPVPGEDRSVLVAVSAEGVAESVAAVSVLVGVGLPVLLGVVGVTTWLVVGRALAPVEAIRREVAGISATQLHRRVPDPPGHDEIARLARTMNGMLARLDEAGARQRRFVSDASHELNSPVASIRQHAEVALAHPQRTTVRELAGTVLAEDLRIQRLVSDLMLLAAADEQSPPPPRRPVDLDDLVFDAARELRARSPLRVDTARVSAGQVAGDAAALRRMLGNVVENAARHAREAVSFTLTATDAEVLLAVDDDGPGVPAAERERILDRFVRLDGARTRDGGGSGLGLAIVAEIAAAHAGRVVVTGSELGGARIEIRLAARQGATVT